MVLPSFVRSVVVVFLKSLFLTSLSLPCAAATVLLDFSSPTCGPCQQMRPVVERLAGDGFQVREVDISRDPQSAARFGVTQVPTFLVLVDGRVVDRQVGATSYDQLRAMLLRATPPAAPRRRVRPLGQSPKISTPEIPTPELSKPIPNTFAAAPVSNAQGSGTRTADASLAEPQVGRVISLEDPSARAARPRTVANPFAKRLGPSAASGAANLSAADRRLIASTVKISVEDAEGQSAGTGTIVDARSGEALVLTCGHLFRNSEGKGPIMVTTFEAGPNGVVAGASYSGQLIDFDLERDLALVSLRPTAPLQAVAIAVPVDSTYAVGAAVTSVGCSRGANPTVIDSRVTMNNRYQGPANVEVAGAPVEGRSGGGLFNAEGQLVGVCFAADPEGNEGLYASLPSIRAKLDSLNLTMIYQPDAPQAQALAAPQAAALAAVALQPKRDATQFPLSVRGQEPEAPSFASGGGAVVAPAALSVTEQAALEEIRRRGADSEVICIIRSKEAGGKSEVITLDNVSPDFVRALTGPSAATAAAGQLLR